MAPPGLAGLEDDSSFSAARLLFLFSASLAPPPPPDAPPSLPPFSLSRSRSLSRLLLVRSDIFTDELLPEDTERQGHRDRDRQREETNVMKKQKHNFFTHRNQKIIFLFSSQTSFGFFSNVSLSVCLFLSVPFIKPEDKPTHSAKTKVKNTKMSR